MCNKDDYDVDAEYNYLAYAHHVYPVGDYRPHELVIDASHLSRSFEEIDDYVSKLCWCKPRYVEGVILHNSMDKREFYENGTLKTH